MKRIILVLALSLFILPFFGESMTVNAAEKTNVTSEQTGIYDKDGTEVMPSNQYKEVIRGIYPPTTVKWINNSASYQSEGFSGSGTRYGGYSFSSRTTNNFRLTLKLGGFGVNVIANPGNPSNVSQHYNLPLSGSPYTINTAGYFYFLVDNPNTGQNYHVKGI